MPNLPDRAALTDMDGVTYDLRLIVWVLHVAHLAEEMEVEPDSLLEMDSNLVSSWQAMWEAKEHSGDCTNEIHLCEICRREDLVEQATRILAALPE